MRSEEREVDLRLFSQRIQDRNRRWWSEKDPFPYKNVGGKLQGRKFAEDHGCAVPEQYALVEKPADLPEFDSLPDRFVLKPSRGWSSKNVFAIQDGVNLLDGRAWSRNQIVEQLENAAAAGRGAPWYLVEEFLVNWDHKPGIPLDYKFFMFGERLALVHVIERNSGAKLAQNRHWYLTEGWELITRRLVRSQQPQPDLPTKPDCWEDMLAVVIGMARELDMFVRIDMYATDRGPVFGEFTPQPHGGKGFTSWADEWLGELWVGVEGAG